MTYRAEIDGLRAFAVLPVILFHAGYEIFAGGFVGVDVFFVISGYLITSIILRESAEGRFSIADFYERRARRILPALIFIVLCCLPFAWMWLSPKVMKDFAQSLIGVATFSSNILFYLESGYFDHAAELKPLLHTWSLAVEEQYYVIFPIFFVLMWRFRLKAITMALVAAFLASLALAQWGAAHMPSAAFFLLPTRGWEILLGALCAIHLAGRDGPYGGLAGHALGLVGLGLIVAAVFAFDATTPVPGVHALVPTLGAALVILCCRRDSWGGRLLATRPLVGVGLISYSAYLWHQPLFAFARVRLLDGVSDLVMGALSALAILLAIGTYYVIERPFRQRGFLSRRAVFALSLAALGGVATVGLAGHVTNGFAGRDGRIPKVAAWKDGDACTIDFERAGSDADARAALVDCLGPAPRDAVLMIGDSHADAFAKPLRAEVEATSRAFAAALHNGCLPIPGTARDPATASCAAFKTLAWDVARETGATVVLSARWRLNFVGPRYDNGEGGVEFGGSGLTTVAGAPDADIFAFAGDRVRDLARTNPVVVVSQIPEAGWTVPERMWLLNRVAPDAPPLSTSYAIYRARNAPVRAWLDALEADGRARVARVEDLVCDPQTDRCLNERDGAPLYRDDDHPAPPYANEIARAIAAALNR